MFEIRTTVNGKKVPLEKFADASMDAIKKTLLTSVAEQLKANINKSGIAKEKLNQVKIDLDFLDDNISVKFEGPKEIINEINKVLKGYNE